MSTAISAGLAGFIVSAQPDRAAIAAAGEALASALVAARNPASSEEFAAALVTAQVYGGPPQASVLGRSERLPATWAAFVNGVATAAPTVSAAVALAELRGASGKQLLEAIAIGLAAGRRVETALAADPGRRAWPAGSVESWLGAAAAAGRLAGLGLEQQVAALALAATQVAGLSVAGPSRIRFGKAAFDGVEAALLAGRGFTGSALPIEGRRGLAALTAPGAKLETLLDGLAELWVPTTAAAALPVEEPTVGQLIGGGGAPQAPN